MSVASFPCILVPPGQSFRSLKSASRWRHPVLASAPGFSVLAVRPSTCTTHSLSYPSILSTFASIGPTYLSFRPFGPTTRFFRPLMSDWVVLDVSDIRAARGDPFFTYQGSILSLNH